MDKEVIIGIYKITNIINNKCYIGQSRDIYQRWEKHKSNIYNSSKNYLKIYQAFRKYGLKNFIFDIIEICSEDKLNERELYWINYYDSYNNGYNSTLGGDYLWHEAIKNTQKEVFQYDLNGNFIQSFSSAHEAQRKTKIQFTNICKVCRGERPQAGGFIWSYIYYEYVKPITTYVKRNTKVAKLNIETGEIIEIYNSAKEAKRKTGINDTSIGRVCKGLSKSAGGFFWKYIDKEIN